MRLFTKQFLYILLPVLMMNGCVQRLAIRTVGGIIDDYGFLTINEESDLALAEQSIASNLKLLEILSKGDPENKNLLQTLTMGYASYALGFVEDDNMDRARVFYLRARDYGLRILREDKKFAAALHGDLESFMTALGSFSSDDVPTIFWTAAGWGGYINMSLTEPEAIASLSKVEAMMQFVVERDPSYFHGAAHIFLGSIYASRPKMLGGDPVRAKKHFDTAIELGEGKFLLAHVLYARWYAVQIQDQDLFENLLDQIDQASIDQLPEVRLVNAIAKKKAHLLRSRINDYF